MNGTHVSLASFVALGMCVCSAGAVELDPVADTYVNRGATDQNYGSSASLNVTNDGGSLISKVKDNYALIRFDISSVVGPITGATFTATSNTDDTFQFQLWAIPDGGADEDFNETTLTFDTFDYASSSLEGSIDLSGLTLLVDSVADGSDGLVDDTYTFSSVDLLNFINADTNGIVTFVLYRTSQSGVFSNFASREASSGGPRLTLVPEPAGAALVAAGGTLLLVRRRG